MGEIQVYSVSANITYSRNLSSLLISVQQWYTENLLSESNCVCKTFFFFPRIPVCVGEICQRDRKLVEVIHNSFGGREGCHGDLPRARVGDVW